MAWETIVTPPAHLNLLTPDQVRADLGIEDDGDNSQIYPDILAVSAKIDAYLRRNLARATVSVAFDEACGEYLRLRRYPTQSITSVTEDGSVLLAADFKVDGETGFLYRRCNGRSTSWSYTPVTIVYVGGYLLPEDDGYQAGAVESLPPDIQNAALIACRALYQSRGRDPMVKSEEIPGVLSQDYWVGTDPGQGVSGMPRDSERLLDPHRNPTAY